MPNAVKPSKPATMIAYDAAFDPEFSFHLRERKYLDLYSIFSDVEDLENNIISIGLTLGVTSNPLG